MGYDTTSRLDTALHSIKKSAVWSGLAGFTSLTWGLLAYFIKTPVLHQVLMGLCGVAMVFFVWMIVLFISSLCDWAIAKHDAAGRETQSNN